MVCRLSEVRPLKNVRCATRSQIWRVALVELPHYLYQENMIAPPKIVLNTIYIQGVLWPCLVAPPTCKVFGSSYGLLCSSYGPFGSSYRLLGSSYCPLCSAYSQLGSFYSPLSSAYCLLGEQDIPQVEQGRLQEKPR